MRIVLLAPSGGGKGSLAEFIVADFGLSHISTGEMFRENVKNKTALGMQVEAVLSSGGLVTDELTTEMLAERLSRPDCLKGFILDGYPRNGNQCKALDNISGIDIAVELKVSDEIVVSRVTSRWICTVCQANHSSHFGPVDKCRKCEAPLYQRSDDSEETVRKRLKIFRTNIGEVHEHYDAQGKLAVIDITSETTKEDVYKEFLEIIELAGLK